MRKTFLIGIRAMLATGLFSIVTLISAPVLPQETAEDESATDSPVFSATIVGNADPTAATTVVDLAIPVDELKLLVKPLSLEELQSEAAAWFLILKEKALEISATEIAIRRGNRAISIQTEASTAITDAEAQLSAAEADLKAATQGTPEYEAAAKRVEEAKGALNEAKIALEKAIKVNKELQEDDSLQETLQEAASEDEATKTQTLLEDAKQARDELKAGSDEYNKATEAIDLLTKALTDIDRVQDNLAAAVPDSPEFTAAETELEKLRAVADTQVKALVESGLIEPIDAESETVETENTAAILENVAEGVEEAEDATGVEKIEDPDATDGVDATEDATEDGADDTQAEDTEDATEDGADDTQAEDTDAVETEVEETPESATEGLGQAAEQLEMLSEADSEIKNQLVENVTKLQGDQTAIIDRFTTVLDELDRKGGDSASYRSYINAVTAVEIDVTDTEGLGVRVWSWIKSEEGGLRWTISILKFGGIILVSAIVSRVLSKVTETTLSKFDAISSLFQGFLVMVVKRGVIVVGFLVGLTSLGVSLGPLLALFGGLSFVLAFALQSNLGNFASGLMLLFYKPFDVGDFVAIPGTPHKGYVREITLANTTFNHYDGRIITVPNSIVWGSSIENLVPGEDRIIEFMFATTTNDDMALLTAAWEKSVDEHNGVNKEMWYMGMPFVSASTGGVYFWCGAFAKNDEKYWDTYTELYYSFVEKIKGSGITLGAAKSENIEYSLDAAAFSEGLLPNAQAKADHAQLKAVVARLAKQVVPQDADVGLPDID